MTPRGERRASAADLSALASLDAACFGRPWSAEVYLEELERPFCLLYVVEEAASIVGSSCTWIVGDEAHLLRIATHPGYRRRGLGRSLLSSVLRRTIEAGCERVLLEVAAGNVAAVALYRGFGFALVGRRRAYYKDPPDDALVMHKIVARPGT